MRSAISRDPSSSSGNESAINRNCHNRFLDNGSRGGDGFETCGGCFGLGRRGFNQPDLIRAAAAAMKARLIEIATIVFWITEVAAEMDSKPAAAVSAWDGGASINPI